LTATAPADSQERGEWARRPWFRPTEDIRPELIEDPIHIPPVRNSPHATSECG
jgi:hypothetical protein